MNDDRENPSDLDVDVGTRVKNWLAGEGYPVEFRAAQAYLRHGYRVFQGYFVRDPESDSPREVDVLAWKSISIGNSLVRVYDVVECKWSQEKPSVVFTSSNARMAPSACIAQTITSELGECLLWALAGDSSLHELELFSTPIRPGFGGRHSFSKGKDHFFDAMKSVTRLASLVAGEYDQADRSKGELPKVGVAAFPIIIVDGLLYEAFYSADTDDMSLGPRQHIRCHWRGAPAWNLHATIDIVPLSSLDEFLLRRAIEADRLLERMELTRNEVELCFAQRSLDPLSISAGSRGVRGLPALLREALADG